MYLIFHLSNAKYNFTINGKISGSEHELLVHQISLPRIALGLQLIVSGRIVQECL